MKKEEEYLNGFMEIENDTIREVCILLRNQELKQREYLANVVASICGVDVNDMLTNTRHLHMSQSRWLYWYAYRYMTNESYDSISEKSKMYRRFAASCVGDSIAKMSMMIHDNGIWSKRWKMIKGIIKGFLDENGNVCVELPQVVTIEVKAPKGVEVKLSKV